MSANETAMPLLEAAVIAARLARAMLPSCSRIEVAGSIRRGKPGVGDIEIVCEPLWAELPDPTDLFGERTITRNLLYGWAMEQMKHGHSNVSESPLVQWIKPGVPGIEPWEPQEAGRYWRGYLPDHGIKLDVFLATPKNWGVILLIRTGSRDFSAAVMGHARRVGFRFDKGALFNDRYPNPLEVSAWNESDVFNYLGLEYVHPRERTGPEAIRPKQGVR